MVRRATKLVSRNVGIIGTSASDRAFVTALSCVLGTLNAVGGGLLAGIVTFAGCWAWAAFTTAKVHGWVPPPELDHERDVGAARRVVDR